jgi:hypothetical protein
VVSAATKNKIFFGTTMVMSMTLVIYEHMNLVVYEHMNLVINTDQIMAMNDCFKW